MKAGIEFLVHMGLLPGHVGAMLDEQLEAKEFAAVGVQQEGTKLILPEGWPLQKGIDFLSNRLEQEEAEIDICEVIEAFPLDGAHALALVIKDVFGFAGNEKTTVNSPFGKMSFNPDLISVEIELGKRIQVPFGEFSLPGIEGTIATKFDKQEDRVVLAIVATTKVRHKETIAKIVALTRQKLLTHSIYKGKAIRVSFRDAQGKKIFFDPKVVPEFINLDADAEPIFTKTTEAQIALAILDPIRCWERLKKHGIKARRTVLLEGDFGTGKTLTALQTAKVCQVYGWTFLYVTNCEDLAQAVKMAQQYSPAAVFAEDVDRVMGGDRGAMTDHLSYVLDGLDTKDRDVMVILTTNNPKQIQKLLLRPGRIDSIISIEKPDAATTIRLMHKYGKGHLRGDRIDLENAIGPMIGQNAAFIAEVMKKANLRALLRNDQCEIYPQDIEVAVKLMGNHVAMMAAGEEPDDHSVPLGDVLVRVRGNGNGSPMFSVD